MTDLSGTVKEPPRRVFDTRSCRKILGHNPDHKLERSRLDVGGPTGSLSRSELCQRTAWHRVDCLLLVSSASDSAAIAPLQQDFSVSQDSLVHNPYAEVPEGQPT